MCEAITQNFKINTLLNVRDHFVKLKGRIGHRRFDLYAKSGIRAPMYYPNITDIIVKAKSFVFNSVTELLLFAIKPLIKMIKIAHSFTFSFTKLHKPHNIVSI